MDPLLTLLVLLLAGTLALALVILGLMGRRRARLEQRIAQVTGGEVPVEAVDLKARINEAVSKTDRGSSIARDLARADLRLTAGEFIMLKVIAAVGMAVIVGWLATQAAGRMTFPIFLGGGVVGAVIGSFFPNIYVNVRTKRRVKAFNAQLADTISMLASSIRSGNSLLQAMELVSREATPPVSTEFRRVIQEVGLGVTNEVALQNLYRRIPSDDLDLMITAINIQHEVGGNLAQILLSISHTIRERVRIKGEINTLTAQGRISAWVITGLPIALGIMMSTINPGYMAPIFTFGLPPAAWCCMPVTASVMVGMGYYVIMKIVNIDI
jgi:tight adherence protein B